MKPLRRRWQQWVTQRHPRSDTHEMTQRNLYIVPSRPGLAFCATLLVLLLASINDQLSLGYLLTFALAGAGFASMHSTHANLRGLSLDLRPPQPCHANEQPCLSLRLHNRGAARYGIGVRLRDSREAPAWVDVPAQGHAELQLRLPPLPRGEHPLPVLRIESRFPLGLFGAWSYWRPQSRLLVFPAPETPPPPLPLGAGSADGQNQPGLGPPVPGDEFQGLRPYRPGDAPRDIHWKRVQPLGDGPPRLWVRERSMPPPREQWLDWQDTAGLGTEQRLSRLCAWVLRCERESRPYGLRLPGLSLAPDLGQQQRQLSLSALARHGAPESGA